MNGSQKPAADFAPGVNKSYFKHFFIPNPDNDHRPAALRPTPLKVYSSILIFSKVFVTLFLFLSYPNAASFSSITASEIIRLTNVERAAQNLPTLTTSPLLTQSAQLKAEDMIANNYFAHTSPQGVNPWHWFKQVGYIYTYAGENLAMDFVDASDVHKAWMASPTHRNNILNPNYKDIGVAVVEGKINGRDTIVLVQHFGTTYVPPVKQEQPQKTPPANPPSEPPATTPAPPLETLPSSYQAKLVARSYGLVTMKTDQAITYWIDFKNTGKVAWHNSGNYFIAVNTTGPAGRVSDFQHLFWKEYYYRPCRLSNQEVKPGEIGRFRFALQAPDKPGQYVEKFQLVSENVTFINGGYFEIPIIVTPPPVVEAATTVEPPASQEPPIANTNVNTNMNANVNENSNANLNENANQNMNGAVTSTSVVSEIKSEQKTTWIQAVMHFTHDFYWVFLVFIIIALLFNILIKIRIQHAPTIFNTLLVIVLTLILLFTKFHFLESVSRMVKIM